MPKRMKNKERELTKLMQKRILLISAALDSDITTKEELCKVTELSRTQLNLIFKENPELYARYCVLRKLLVEIASDNISAIVEDRGHPKNYDASKWVVTNFKSDLDSVLESKEESLDVEINGSGNSKASPITIRFGKRED